MCFNAVTVNLDLDSIGRQGWIYMWDSDPIGDLLMMGVPMHIAVQYNGIYSKNLTIF